MLSSETGGGIGSGGHTTGNRVLNSGQGERPRQQQPPEFLDRELTEEEIDKREERRARIQAIKEKRRRQQDLSLNNVPKKSARSGGGRSTSAKKQGPSSRKGAFGGAGASNTQHSRQAVGPNS